MSSDSKNAIENEVNYEIPDWAGIPPNGYHLDVTKNDKLIQKLMIDEKRAYYFGRNPKTCDFIVEHASCSRCHAVLLYHKHLNRFFLVDLGSSHGTYIGTIRLESLCPQFVQLSNTFHFGASTRRYVLRAKLTGTDSTFDDVDGIYGSNLPERAEELENLTEYNTALNRRISSLPIPVDDTQRRKRARTLNVSFGDEETIINPEDVDPSVGRFRNMITTAVIPAKRIRTTSLDSLMELEQLHESANIVTRTIHHAPKDATVDTHNSMSTAPSFGVISSSLGISMNPAPDIQPISSKSMLTTNVKRLLDVDTKHRQTTTAVTDVDNDEPHRKKYAKEAWPGRKPTSTTGHLM